jgi:predicted GNAT family acetyltransferase
MQDEIVDDVSHHRYVLAKGDEEAELVYRLNGNRLVLIHAGVPESFRGEGVAARLTRAALERAEEEGLTVVPMCPYVRKFLEDHPDEAARVQIDWPAAPPES